MNSNFKNLPPEERALRLTALLLGELSPAEAESVRLALAADAELAREHDRLQQTIALVRETAALERKTSSEGTPLRLDEQRREKLLAAFKTPAPSAPLVVSPRRARNLRFLPLALAAALVGLLLVSVMLPSVAKSKARAQRTSARLADTMSDEFAVEKESPKSEVFLGRVLSMPRGESKSADKRESELALTENFSLSVLDADGLKAQPIAPAAKLPSIALALPALANTDGDARALKENLSEFNTSGWKEKAGTESLARSGVNRELARAGAVLSGTLRGFFDDNQNATPAPAVPAPQGAATYRYEVAGLVGGNGVVAQSMPENFGTLWGDNNWDRPMVAAAGNSPSVPLQNSPAAHGGGNVDSAEGVGYVNNNLIAGYNLISTPRGDAPSTPSPARSLSVEEAESIVEARRSQLPQTETPTTPGRAVKFAALGELSAREAGQGEINDQKLFREVESAWSSPAILPFTGADSFSGGGGGRNNGAARGGLVGGGAAYAGVSIAPGGQSDLVGRNAGSATAVGQTVDGLADVMPAPLAVRARIADANNSRPEAPGAQFEFKLKQVEDRFGRADDFVLTPEVLDAVKQKIQSAPSSGGMAGMSAAKDSLSASRPSISTTPSASGRVSFLKEITPAPVQRPVPPVSGPDANGGDVTFSVVPAFETAAYLTINSGLITNGTGGGAPVKYFSDLPATAGDKTVHWDFSGGGAAANGLGDVGAPIPRAGKDIGNHLKQRVEVQLPGQAPKSVDGRGVNGALPQVAAPIVFNTLAADDGGIRAGVGEVRFSKRLNAANSFSFAGTNVLLTNSVLPAAVASEPELAKKVSTPATTPQPEVLTRDNAFSTFSLNVADVSFKLAAASLEKGAMPDVATIRSEEFINAFDYRDPVPMAGVPLAFVSERARYPFAHNRDVLRFSVKTAAQGRDGGKPLNIVLLLDNSGSMERADRVRIIQEALRALAAQLQPQDKLSVVTFSRTARLWADGVSGAQATEVAKKIATLTPEGGTNLEEALDLAYRTALRHYAATAMNRVVLLTDGAANLGNVEPATLKAKVENFRKQGVALDCFGIGWEGFNDDLLEQLSRNGDGRYGFVNTPEEAATEFAGQLAGALQVAASDVKVQVEFNPRRVTAYRQVGYAKHQLTKEQFRDNKVDAAEISASEAGNALYVIETNPRGEGPIATVRARFRIPQTSDYREHEWVVPFGSAVELEQSSTALRLATSASAFSEWLAGSPFADEVTTDRLLGLLTGVPEVYGADPRPKKLEWMIRQAKSISGK